MSIDVINSVLAKEDVPPGTWAKYLSLFFHEIVASCQGKFLTAVQRYCEKCEKPCVPNLKKKGDSPKTNPSSCHVINLRKYIGDEVILETVLTCPQHHASLHVLALADIIRQLNDDPNIRLRFKGTAWYAAFPIRNVELDLPVTKNKNDNEYEDDPKSENIRDFFGPSIDLGFRLSKFASEDQLIVSPSLGYLIAKEENKRVPLYFGGMKKIEGFKNKQPLLWYPINRTLESTPVESKVLTSFIEEKYASEPSYIPFIDPPSDTTFDEACANAIEEQKKIEGSIYKDKETPGKTCEVASGKDLEHAVKEGRLPEFPQLKSGDL